MVHPQQVQQRRLQIVHMHRIFHNVVAILIRLAVRDPRLHAPTRHPHRKTTRMMVPPVVVFLQLPLTVHRPPELPAPNHQRIVQHPPLLQIPHQRRRRLVRLPAPRRHTLNEPPVVVPIPVVELNKPHPALRQPPRHQTVIAKRARLPRIRPVQVKRALRLFTQICQLRHGSLHLVSHLILRNPRRNLRIARLFKVLLVQLRQRIEIRPPVLPAKSLRIIEIQHRRPHAPELHPLIARRQKPRSPQPVVQRLPPTPRPRRNQHNKPRQVLRLAPQPVAHPTANTRPPRNLRPRLQKRHRRVMVNRLGMQTPHHRQVINDLRRMRQQIAHPCPALPVPRKAELRRHHRKTRLLPRHPRQPLPPPDRIRQLGLVNVLQLRLIVKGLQLRRPPGLKQVNHPLRPRRMVIRLLAFQVLKGRDPGRRRGKKLASGHEH